MQAISLSIQYQQGQLKLLDQTQLPDSETWLNCETIEDMFQCILKLQVRGAPAIGVAAGLSLAQWANKQIKNTASEKIDDKLRVTHFIEQAQYLRSARPTAVNLMYVVDELIALVKSTHSLDSVEQKAIEIFNEDIELCRRISENGASLIEDGDSVVTHCNTGGLATAGAGTALGIIRRAHEMGKKFHVYVDETRPLLQGGRLTTWELEKLGIPYTLICDNMAAMLAAQGKITKAFVGADRIAKNGDFANKVGTYSLAIVCRYHKIPFYIAAPFTTIDLQCPSGEFIEIEQRSPEEVQGVKGSFGKIRWAPVNAQVYNPAFDVTPYSLVTGWITDKELTSIPNFV